jgi:tetratricopeptide (TPR) repeat protein
MRKSCVRGIALHAVFACFFVSPVVAVAPSAPPAGTAPTLQQSFDQATDAAAKGDCATALPIFERLATDRRLKSGSLPSGTIAVRRGICLAGDQRYDDAEQQILVGLPILRNAGPDMAADVAEGEEALGNIAIARRDHDGAIAHFKAAIDLRPEPLRGVLLVRLAQVSQFDAGDAPLVYLDEAQRIFGAAPKPDRSSLAAIHTVRGRVFMNRGRNKEALAELKLALSFSGGLTDRISLADASMRGDLAEAALLNGQKDQARIYLAYTGAGRIKASPFAVAASMAPPQCGPETGLSPKDSAIVEFGIDDAGDVPFASTVYTRGDYAVASAFAQAVEQWYWRPEDLAKIPPFYKTLTRVELRCSATGGDLPGVTVPLRQRFETWAKFSLDGIDLSSAKLGSNLDRLASLAKRREASGDLPGAVAALTARGILNPYIGPAALVDFDRALTLARTAHLPSDVVDAILVFRHEAEARGSHKAARSDDPAGVDAILHEYPALSEDALASDTLLVLVTPSAPSVGQRADAEATLHRVADDTRLAEHHPLRQVALLRLANLTATEGKLDDAHAYFLKTGLSEEQCSLIGVSPAMKSSGASSNDFPMEALQYGFEGWVNLEFDINANGTTANARPVIAYPPFVFVDAASGMARDIRYQASYRPSDSLACSAHRETIRFQIPQNH